MTHTHAMQFLRFLSAVVFGFLIFHPTLFCLLPSIVLIWFVPTNPSSHDRVDSGSQILRFLVAAWFGFVLTFPSPIYECSICVAFVLCVAEWLGPYLDRIT